MIQQAPFIKLSDYIKSNVPDVNFDDAKKIIIAYRNYMFNLRGNKDQISNFCDVCYNLISEEEAAKTSVYDFNYCCDKHSEYRNIYQLDIARKKLGITTEHLPMIDIYG